MPPAAQGVDAQRKVISPSGAKGQWHRFSQAHSLPRATSGNHMRLKPVITYMHTRRALLICATFASWIGFAQQAVPSKTPTDAAISLSQDEIRELIRHTAENNMENDKRQRDYTYIQREEQYKLNGKGQVKSTEIKTSEIMELYGEQVERLISKDDKPLSDKDNKKEEEKIQKVIEKRKNESEKDREKREEKEEKDREQGRQFVREVADAYNFHFAGIESLAGRYTYVIDAEPRPGYQGHLKESKFLPKFRFRAWIDKDESQWKKLDIQCIDTVSWGLFLARIHKGSRIIIETTRVNDEVWLPQHINLKVDARLALLKDFNVEEDITYHDYKKFRTGTKIVPIGEAQQP
jgi:hypothetical protein